MTPLGPESKQPTWQGVENFFKQHPSVRLYALVDGALNEGFLSRLEKHWPVREFFSIYANLPERNDPEVSPLLVPIEPIPQAAGETVFKRCVTRRMLDPESVLFFWATSPGAELAAHLGRHAEIRTFEGKRALLRFHDPNILPAMLALQTEVEQAHFFSGIAEIWRPDLDDRWWRYRSEARQNDPGFVAVSWDETRHQRFAALTEPRKVLQRLEEDYDDRLSGSREAWLKKLGTWIEQAEKLKANTPSEHYLYCVTALFTGERFHETPEVAEELSAIGLRHANFTAAIQAVSPEVWERLENLSQGQMIQAY